MNTLCCINCCTIIDFTEDQWVPLNCTCPDCDTKMYVEQEYQEDLGDSLLAYIYDDENKDHTSSDMVVGIVREE